MTLSVKDWFSTSAIRVHYRDIPYIYFVLFSCQLSAGQNIYTSNIPGLDCVLLLNLLRFLSAADLSPAGSLLSLSSPFHNPACGNSYAVMCFSFLSFLD